MIACDKQQWNPDPNDPVLTDLSGALYEPRAVVRMMRRGWLGLRFVKFLGIDPPELLSEQITEGLKEENLAHRRGQTSIEDGDYC